MKRILKSRLAVCILAVLVVGLGVVLASDVVVKPGKIEVDWVDASSGLVQTTNVWASGDVYADDIDADDYITAYAVVADFIVGNTAGIFEKIDCNDFDPAYVLFRETRAGTIERIAEHVPPGKQGGAAMFFNSETKKLEIYVASEGAFYDLRGKLLEALPAVVPPRTQYEDVFYLDPQTGQVKSWKKAILDRYVVKDGYELDRKTGQFMDLSTGLTVAREEAVEIQPAGQ